MASLSRLFVWNWEKHKILARCQFLSSSPMPSLISYSDQTYTTSAISAYMWFLEHAISAVDTRSLQPEKTQRTTANSRRKTLRAQLFSHTYCCWRCVCKVRVSNLHTLRRGPFCRVVVDTSVGVWWRSPGNSATGTPVRRATGLVLARWELLDVASSRANQTDCPTVRPLPRILGGYLKKWKWASAPPRFDSKN